jgi:hypothetical protein
MCTRFKPVWATGQTYVELHNASSFRIRISYRRIWLRAIDVEKPIYEEANPVMKKHTQRILEKRHKVEKQNGI